MLKQDFPSIEKFAAYLDGNLPWSEMHQFSQMAEHDNALHQLLDASTVADKTLSGFTDSNLQLPPEIAGPDFELPTIPAEGILPLVTLSPEPMDDMLVAAAACAEEDISMFADDQYDNVVDNSYDNPSPLGFHDHWEGLCQNNSTEDMLGPSQESFESSLDDNAQNINQITFEDSGDFQDQDETDIFI